MFWQCWKHYGTSMGRDTWLETFLTHSRTVHPKVPRPRHSLLDLDQLVCNLSEHVHFVKLLAKGDVGSEQVGLEWLGSVDDEARGA